MSFCTPDLSPTQFASSTIVSSVLDSVCIPKTDTSEKVERKKTNMATQTHASALSLEICFNLMLKHLDLNTSSKLKF